MKQAQEDFQPWNLNSQAAKTRHWKAFDRIRQEFEDKYKGVFKDALTAQVDQALGALLLSPEAIGAESLVDRATGAMTEDPVREAYESMEEVFLEFANMTFHSGKKAIKQDPEIEDAWSELFRQFVETEGADLIVQVTETTKQMVRLAVLEGHARGLGISKIMDEIQKRWIGVSDFRSERVARTETLRAAVSGTVEGGKSFGATHKEWISTKDDRTRGPGRPFPSPFDHHDTWPDGPDGEVKEIDDDFTGTGESLRWPGDPRGSKGNTIMCRCAVAMLINPTLDSDGRVAE